MSSARRGRTVVYASGAELQTLNPLLTIHPLAKQIERYVLLTTPVRYHPPPPPAPFSGPPRAWGGRPPAPLLPPPGGGARPRGRPAPARRGGRPLNRAPHPRHRLSALQRSRR